VRVPFAVNSLIGFVAGKFPQPTSQPPEAERRADPQQSALGASGSRTDSRFGNCERHQSVLHATSAWTPVAFSTSFGFSE
jgi:hypothetical protein